MSFHDNLKVISILSKFGFLCRYDVISGHDYSVSGNNESNAAKIPTYPNLYNGLAVDPVDFLPGQKLLGVCNANEHQQTEQQSKCDFHGFPPFEVYDPMPALVREGAKILHNYVPHKIRASRGRA
jgi:hypothetical protein